MEIINLGSSSKGNMTIIRNEDDYLVIDLGFSFSKIILKLDKVEIDVNCLTNILITHEHLDHTQGIKKFAKQVSGAKFYFSKGTNRALLKEGIEVNPTLIKKDISFSINSFKITPLELSHDANEPLGFLIECNNKKIVYITDTGIILNKYDEILRNCNLYILEANHDLNLLFNSPKRTKSLKQRIASDKGHLNNEYVCKKLNSYVSKKSIWAVAHISKDCNKIEKIEESMVLNLDNPFKFKTYYFDDNKETKIKI